MRDKLPDGLVAHRPPAVVLGDLSLIWPLGMAKIPIILLTADPNDVAIRSRYVAAHRLIPGFEEANIEGAAARIVEIGSGLSGALGRKVPLYYSSDKHLELIYRHRRALEEHYLLALNDDDLAWSLHDKESFARLVERAGVLAPKTFRPGADFALGLAELREPLLVKPRRKATWKAIQRALFDGRGKARVFATRAELLAHPGFGRHAGDVIVQEYIPGGNRHLLSFHGFADAESRILASFCGRKIRTFPALAGESALIELTRDARVDGAGREIVAILGLKGPFKIDFIEDARTGALLALEINARYTLWNRLGAAHGVNLPAIAYDHLVYGRSPAAPANYEPRYRWMNGYRDYLAVREERGCVGLGAWAASLVDPRVLHETFAWRDPTPFVAWASGFLRARVRKWHRRRRALQSPRPARHG